MSETGEEETNVVDFKFDDFFVFWSQDLLDGYSRRGRSILRVVS